LLPAKFLKFHLLSVKNNKIIFANCIVAWGPVRKTGKHPSYTFITSNGHNIFVNYLEFNVGSMQYSLKGSSVQLPSTGLVRNYTCSQVDAAGEYLFAGTTGGEICIFSLTNQIFKAALPVISKRIRITVLGLK